MDLLHRPCKVTIIGQAGQGKSTFQERYLLNTKARIRFCFDPEGEYQHRLGVRPAGTVTDLMRSLAGAWCLFDPTVMFPGNLAAGFDFFATWAFTVSEKIQGRKIFACDELQKWVGNSSGSMPKGLALVLETGRKRKLDSCLIAQQSNIIHNRVRGQTTELVCFKTLDKTGLEWPVSLGVNPDTLRNLRIGQFLALNTQTGTVSQGQLFK